MMADARDAVVSADSGSPALVGILGGLGPMASALLARMIVESRDKAGATFDHDHADFILYQAPMLPNARLAMLNKGPSPYDGYVRCFRALMRAGATEVCVCCNTAHPLARSAAAEVGVPFLDMIKITAKAALQRLAKTAQYSSNREPLKIGLMATDATLRMGLYQEALDEEASTSLLQDGSDRSGGPCYLVPDEAGIAVLQQCILDIKAGKCDGIGGLIEGEARRLVEERGAMCIITGCTELPVCFGETAYPTFPVPIIDPVTTLADAVAARGCRSSSSASV